MSIVCGTDFSEEAGRAASAAARLARRLNEPLELVHAAEEIGAGQLPGSEQEPLVELLRQRLREQADRLRAMGLEVREHLLTGAPDEALVGFAARLGARMVVVASLGAKKPRRWLLGSVAERTARSSSVPVLVLRDSAGLEAWLNGSRPLQVVVGLSFSRTSEAALRWVAGLREIGPCDITGVYVVWPPSVAQEHGFTGRFDFDTDLEPLEEVLHRELSEGMEKLPGEGRATVRILPGLGDPAPHLTGLAERLQADLLVVGTHQRQGAQRLWYGSVSRAVLTHSALSVACVPSSAVVEERRIPELRRVLVPTDLSECGNLAVAQACAVLPRGGELILLYVRDFPIAAGSVDALRREAESSVEQERALEASALADQLRGQVPPEAVRRGIRIEVEVVDDDDVAGAIHASAERLGVDLICMGSHGRAGLMGTLMGSVSQGVLTRSRRPLLLVRPPRED